MTSLATSPDMNNSTPAYSSPSPSVAPSGTERCPRGSQDDDPSTKITGSSQTYTTTSQPTTTTQSTTDPSSSSSSDSGGVSQWVKDIFNATFLNILFWLMTIYIIYRLGLAMFAKKPEDAVNSGQLTYSRTIDITLALIIIFALVGSYYNLPEDEQDNLVGYTIEWTYNFFNNPWSLLILIWFTIIFFLMVYILRVPTAPDVKPILVKVVEDHIWVFFLIFAIIFFFKYVLNIQIVNLLLNNDFMRYLQGEGSETATAPGASPSWWTTAEQGIEQSWDNIVGETPTTNVQPSNTTSSTSSATYTTSPSDTSTTCDNNQVFNISQNKYTYKQAQEVCKAFDASLATYDQIEDAYNNGAEWCNYGWSAGQMAYFPTQKSTYNKLAQNPYTKNACGRPGINGGFMGNPKLRFGVNCYGSKPSKPDGWVAPKIIAPKSPCEGCPAKPNKKEEQMNKMKKNAQLAGFNENEWSEF